MSEIEQAAAAAVTPAKAKCRACYGDGESGDYVGSEMMPVAVPCDACSGSGEIEVGVFDPICARHCHLCKGQDHHWSYDGDMDEDGEPLMGCRHCPALRLFTQDDDENCDF
jgi:hypothetical protein